MLLAASLFIVLLSGCFKTEEEKQKEQLVGNWFIVGHCHELGHVSFLENNEGTIRVNDECLVGDDCINSLPFNWTLSDGTVFVSYDFTGFSGIICDDVLGPSGEPSPESFEFSENTEVISLYGYVFEYQE